jgi:hypothetical protein
VGKCSKKESAEKDGEETDSDADTDELDVEMLVSEP